MSVLSSASLRIKYILEIFCTADVAYTDKDLSDTETFQDIPLKIVNSHIQSE